MSLEEAVQRLANAIGMHDDAAVKEIIRQRDAALKDAKSQQERSEMYERWYNEERTSRHYMERQIRSLRGVITRMKRKTAQG